MVAGGAATYVRNVVLCEKDLGNGLLQVLEESIPERHETALSNCR